MVSFNLVDRPWIPVLSTAGAQQRGLQGVFDPDVIAVTCDDPLEDAAITRLLLAVQIAAGAANVSAAQWLSDHAEHFDLLDEACPFWQNPDMARFADQPGAWRPLTAASYRHAGSWSAAVNVRHNASGYALDLAAAARLIVVRQQFSVGGVQPFIAAAYGKAPMSAKLAVATNRPFVWMDTGRLAESLQATAALIAGASLGRFWFTWPSAHTPADPGEPSGVLDALTWPARSILLGPTGAAGPSSIAICDGLRWPEPRKDAPGHYGPQRQIELIPHTIYTRKKPTDPYTVQSVHPDRSVWRQLAAWCVDADSPAAAWQPAAAERRARWRLTGIGSFQSAIYGPISGSFPAPTDRDVLAEFLHALADTYKQIGSTAGSLARQVSDYDGYGPTIPAHAGLDAIAAPVAADLAAGRIDLTGAQAVLRDAAATVTARAYRAVGRVRPLAAGRVAARKANAADAAAAKGSRR